MEAKRRKSVRRYIRVLHRDIGFFVAGLVIVYSLSGIVLVYRDTGFLMRDVQVEKQLSPGMAPSELGGALRMRGFSVTKTEGDVVHFRGGSYNRTTGRAAYRTKELPPVVDKCVELHRAASGRAIHWCSVLIGVLLCFLAVSSFWMYPTGTGLFRRGIYIAIAGMVVTIVVLLF